MTDAGPPPGGEGMRRVPVRVVVVVGLLLVIGAVAGGFALRGAKGSAGKDGATRGTTVSRAVHAPVPRAVRAPKARPRLSGLGIYAADAPNRLSPAVRGVPARVYVPNSLDGTVTVIDQRRKRVIGRFATGQGPNHVTPAADLRRLWVDNTEGNSLTPIDPRTGRPGVSVPVRDPYNLYFTPGGRFAIVVAEASRALDFRDPRTMRLRWTLAVPACGGVNHMDFTADGTRALVSCEFAARMVVVDLRAKRVIKQIRLPGGAKPQDVKLSPDGRIFYVADMTSNGVWLFDARKLRRIGFVATGAGAHGLYPSRDARVLYVSNRGEGTISLISFRTRRPVAKWRLPGGGSPDMGGVSANGRVLWLSGRYNSEIYAISTENGRLVARIPVGNGPHGMAVWPQPGRASLGHTGNLR